MTSHRPFTASFQKEPADGPTTTAASTSSFRIPKKKPGGTQPNGITSQSPLNRTALNTINKLESGDRSRSSLDSGDRSRGSSRVEMDYKSGVREVFKAEPRDNYGGRAFKQEYKPSFGAGTSGEFVIPRKVDIEMNGLQLNLSAAPEFVNRYHITITKILRNKEKDATKGPKEDLPTQHRRRALFSVFKQLVKSNPEAFGEDRYKHVYDLGNTFYSVGCNITQADGDRVFRIPAEDIGSEFSRNFLSKGGLKELVFTVQWTGQVYIKGPKLNQDDGTRREAARFFDVLTSQILFHGDHYIFANKFFEKQYEFDVRLGEGKCVKSGFEKNVRFLGDSDESAVPILQIDTKKSPFYSEQSVLDFVREITGRNPEDALSQKSLRKKVAKELRDLVVTTTHMKNNRYLYVHGVVDNNARNQFFETDMGEISVEQYFFQQYKFELRYPLLPLVAERKGASGLSFYPLEVLKIERGQRVDNKKLAGQLTDKMIKHARMLPPEMREHNRRMLENGRLKDDENAYLYAFGVEAANNFVTCEAKVLSAPEIKYKSDSLQPDRSGPMLSWRLNQRTQFVRPATVESVSIAVFDKAVMDQQALHFFEALSRAGRARGMTIPNNCAKVVQLPSEVDEIIEEHFRSCAGRVSMILCITRIKKDDVHDTIKMLEAKHGVVTQHVSKDTALACINGGKTLENVLLKFNLKNKGLNHSVGAPRQALSSGTTQKDINGKLFQGKMFVGFELSHAGAQSLYDRQNTTAVKEPTVIGGTSRPTRYTIVAEDKPQISVEVAEHLTHFLCHGHQQSTLPTHVPAVLYAAENLAKRGRAAWKSSINENCDGASSSYSQRVSLRDGETPEDFYNRFTLDLMNSLPNHYFA
ncbi:PAZ domain protein [Necator americanus]|uniref:PAZ domain protein n=1 Tax=Necator americanus TaxID=51031 RepID=W2SLI3_NECAM|nr:PAZ domain protein [Necator americanus]ETN70470.1 PAZ domain protein [Necator americanus]